jgi:hypothetical protein
MKNVNVLTGHVSFETAYFVDDNSGDRRRKKKYYWIDSRPTVGDRLATVSINPETGIPNTTRYPTVQYQAQTHSVVQNRRGHRTQQTKGTCDRPFQQMDGRDAPAFEK